MIHGKDTGIPGNTRFEIKGTVVEHITRSTGWWIFKTKYPGMKIQLDAEELESAIKEHGLPYNGLSDGAMEGIHWKNPIEVYVPADEAKEKVFPVGTTVAVTFAQSGAIDQFFKAAEIIMIVNVRKIAA